MRRRERRRACGQFENAVNRAFQNGVRVEHGDLLAGAGTVCRQHDGFGGSSPGKLTVSLDGNGLHIGGNRAERQPADFIGDAHPDRIPIDNERQGMGCGNDCPDRAAVRRRKPGSRQIDRRG